MEELNNKQNVSEEVIDNSVDESVNKEDAAKSEPEVTLEINGLKKRYINSKRYSINDLTLHIRAGEIFGFLGQNGAGKSTTIKCITGIHPYDEGQIVICGHDMKTDPIGAKKNIGYVPDNHSVYEKLTGREYVNYIADLYGVPLDEREERMNRYLKMFKITFAVDRQIKGYSHGMKQKICIIAALIHNPRLWVLDEPMVGLDPQSMFDIIDEMKEHTAAGNTVFFSSHNIDLVSKLCDRVAIIHDGELKRLIDLHEEGTRETLEQVFRSLTMAENKA